MSDAAPLSPDHAQYLMSHAVTAETIEKHGVYSQDGELVFPWRDGDNVTHQRRPWPGSGGQYYWEKDKDLHFWDLRDAGPSSTILLVEGTKQSLAAASHADPAYSVLGMAGCEGWNKCDLSRFENRRVVMVLDADAGSNLSVYEAGDLFRQEVEFYEADVSFLWLPGRGTQGLDDVLAKKPERDRSRFLSFLLKTPHTRPAEKKPSTRKGATMETELPDTGDRVGVAVNEDRKQVIDRITDAMRLSLDGSSLFNYGDVLTRVVGHETKPLDRDSFYGLIADTVACYNYTPATDKKPAVFTPAWPDTPTMGAVMSKADMFSPLTRVVRVPFLRADGTVCTTPGYDKDTSTVLVPGSLDVDVPESPTQLAATEAAEFLMEEWLGDFPMGTRADKANALALVLTPFIRGLVPLVPLAVVNGLEAGVGKNLLADCVSILATGDAAMPLPWVGNDEEMRKQITASFASGNELFIFDEAHVVEGAQMARALTSLTYGDRVLGVSRIAKFPNQATWVSLGNQVHVNGDMSRRVYFIALRPVGTTLSDRDSRKYRHPDIKRWTTENRSQLVCAALTVLRGWHAAGSPPWDRGASLGSFEPWDRLMSSVLAFVGYPEFLTDTKERRSESDFDQAYWEAHLAWAREVFGSGEFTTRQVQEAALRQPALYESPPKMDDPTGKSYTRELGRAYSKHQDRRYGKLRLIKSGMGHRSTLKWVIQSEDDGGREGTEGTPHPLRVETQSSSEDTPVVSHGEGQGAHLPSLLPSEPGHIVGADNVINDRVPFDIETGSADDLFSTDYGTFVKLVGVGERVTSTSSKLDMMTFTGALCGLPLVGVNNFFFDSIAMDRHHNIPVEQTIIGSRDLRIAAFQNDPPTSYETKSGPGFKSYSMDALSERYLGRPGKSGLGAALAKEYGGWDAIPASDPRYAEYLREDLAVTAELDAAIPYDPYEEREARVCAVTARATLNGFKVDMAGLQARVQADAERSDAGKAMLAEEYGFPLTNKAGKPAAAPQRTEAGKAAFGAALDGLGFPVANWPRGKDESMSLSKETMAFALNHAQKHVPAAVSVIEAVQAMNGLRTTAASLLGNVTGGRVHYPFEPFQTTGRWSCGLTVLKKGVADSERYLLTADDDETLVSIDLDQIDIRAVAAHAQDPNLIALLNDPTRDFHQEIADRTGVARKPAKTLDLGWLYGRGMRGMVENTEGVTMEAAQGLDQYMRAEFSRVVGWQNEVRELGENGVLLDNGFGRKLRVDPERAYTQAPAMYGQSTTRDLIAEGLLTLAATAPEILPMLRVIVHDEVVLSVPRKDREEIARTVQSAMSRMWAPAGASIPVSITAGQGKPFVFGDRWGSLYQ